MTLMTDHNQESLSRNLWASPICRLNNEVVGFNKHIGDITDIITQNLDAGRIAAQSNTISVLKDQLSSISFDASSILPRLDRFAAIVDTPSSLLLDNQKSAFLSSDLVVDSVRSILSSTAYMAATIRSANEHLCITNQGQIEGLRTDSLLTSLMKEASISVHPLSKDNILMLGDRLKTDISTFNNLIDSSLSMSRLCAEVYAQPIKITTDYLTDLNQSLTTLNSLSGRVYNDFIGLQSIDTSCFLFQAPIVEPYAAMRATAILAGVDDGTLDQLAVVGTDGLLDKLGDELVSRLETVNPELAQVYQEGITVIESGQHGWIRHAGVSFRTMFDHLLRHLGPDSDLRSFFKAPESEMVNGEFKRNARLRYIFREVATGSYAQMAEQDIKLAEATFFPSNDIVHRLSSPLSEKQMRVFFRRIQGSVSVVLEAAGY
jgi:hypothetical protein